tara:strand:+ start:179 stop:397 length:219 start_codon:yes stop_codon:yes gene_type:complete
MKMEEKIREIAEKVLRINRLEVRGMDDLDFHDLHVSDIKLALEAAYTAGQVQAINARIAQVAAKIAELKEVK